MKNRSRPFDDQVHPGLLERIGKDLQRGVSRRNILYGLLTSGILATTAGGLLTVATSLYAQSPRRGGRIKVASASSSSADTLDPAKGSNSTDYTRAHMFYSGLTRLLVPQRALAESFATEGALLWTVKLRRDVRFHDGMPFTSADVLYSLTRHKKPETGSKALAVAMQFAEVKARGPHEVQIRLTTPTAGHLRYVPLSDRARRHRGFQHRQWHRPVQVRGVPAGRAIDRLA